MALLSLELLNFIQRFYLFISKLKKYQKNGKFESKNRTFI
jgi:hypothetical protein